MADETAAAIDIGTNSVRLLILDAGGVQLERHMNITRLGQGVDATGELHPAAVARTLRIVEKYAALIREYGTRRVRVVATSAARDAKNRDPFFRAVQALLAHEPELLSGEEEAVSSFRGATAVLDPSLAPFLVFDIGGGSTELALGSERPEASASLNLGSVRISERFLRSDPPLDVEVNAAGRHVARVLEGTRKRLDASRARTWVGLAGTVTSMAAMAQGLTHYDSERIHSFELGASFVRQAFQQLRAADVTERRKLLIEPQRAEAILGGGIVLLGLFDVFELSSFRVSESDILDGLAASLFD